MAKKSASKKAARRSPDNSPHVLLSLSIEGSVDDDPLAVLSGIAHGTKMLDKYANDAVAIARDQRYTWAEIGEALGITRQSAWERFATG